MLSNRWIINALLVLVITVLVYIGLDEGDETDAMRATRISALRPADVDRIEIRSEEFSLELGRHDAGWQIESPVDWPAHDANVWRLLSILDASASPLGSATGLELETLGLETPRASLRFNDTRLLFGASNNIGERRYLMVDSTLYLLPDIHLAFITQGLPGMVERRLLPPRYAVSALRLPGFEVTRDGDDRWRSTHTPEFSQAQLQRLIGNWQDLQASRVKRYDDADNVMQVIQARLADGRSIDFRLLAVEPEIVIANPQIGLQYHFREDYHDQLISPVPDDAG